MEKKTNKNHWIVGGLMALDALLLLTSVKVIAPVCTGLVETAAGKQVPMRCHYTGAVLVILGILLLADGVLCMVKKEKTVCGSMAVFISVFTFLVLGSTLGMGVCANTEMACNVTAAFAKVCGGVGVIVGVISIYLGIKEAK